MTIDLRVLRNARYAISAVLVFAFVAIPVFGPMLVSADQLAERSITLSDSGPSGGTITSGIGSGTGVNYKVSFTTNLDAEDANSIVIDFCQNTPIISDTCTEPAGMDVSAVTLDTTDPVINDTDYNATGTATGDATTTIKILRDTTGDPLVGNGSIYTFTLGNITNPSTTGTFYARIYTYPDDTATAYTDPENLGPGTSPYVDYGGIALSTNQIITITARVQEQLTFCVTSVRHEDWTVDRDCSAPEAATPPALELGHGTPTKVLTADQRDIAPAYSQISTNATNGAVISIRNSNAQLVTGVTPSPCGGLSANGEDCAIPAIGTGAATLTSMVAGTAAFGVAVNDGQFGEDAAGTVVGTGTVIADNNYRVVHGTETDADGISTIFSFGMDEETTTDAGSVVGPFGDRIAYSSAPLFRINNTYTFAATASLTTPAGIYTANIDLVATGTF